MQIRIQRTTFMIAYRRIVRPPPLAGGADAGGLARPGSCAVWQEEERRQEADLVDWEDEGGNLAAPAIAPQTP